MIRLITALLFALLSACSPIGFGEQEVFLAHDAKADKLRMLIVYDSIEAVPRNSKDGVKEGREFAERVSRGKRVFMLHSWPLCVDLDEDADFEVDAGDEWRALAQGVRVVRAGYCSSAQLRPSLFQSIEIDRASVLIARLERGFLDALAEGMAAGEFAPTVPWMDERTLELWQGMVREKRDWLSLEDGVLAVDLPMTAASAAALLSLGTQQAVKEGESMSFLAGLLSHLTELRIADERIVLRWKLAGPTMTFRGTGNDGPKNRLEQSLRESKSLPESMPTRHRITQDWLGR